MALDIHSGNVGEREDGLLETIPDLELLRPVANGYLEEIRRELLGCLNHWCFFVDLGTKQEFGIYIYSVKVVGESLHVIFGVEKRIGGADVNNLDYYTCFESVIDFSLNGEMTEISICYKDQKWSSFIGVETVRTYFDRMSVLALG